MEKSNLFEFYVDKDCEGFVVLKNSPAVVILPHFMDQFKSRIKLVPYKQLMLPTSAKALATTAFDECKGLLTSTSKSYVGGSEKVVYCKRYPIAVMSKETGKSIFSCYLEVGVLFSVSTPMFDRKAVPELANELFNMRRSNASLKDRNQFIRDNCHDSWKPLLDDGTVSDGKILILVESVIVTLSENPAEAASWTFFKNRIDQEGHLLTLSEDTFVNQILRKLLKDKDTILALRSKEAREFASKHGLSLNKKGSHSGKYKRNTDPNYNVVPKSDSKA